MGCTKSRTSPYHPAGNGMCEHFNQTLMNMLGTLEPEQKANWKAHVGPMVHAYNATRHGSTGQAPLNANFALLFGCQPWLPIDLILDLPEGEGPTYNRYVAGLRERLKESYELATREAEKSRNQQKRAYDHRARAAVLSPGDRVLVRILAYEGKHKIADRWENEVYVVLEQPNMDIPVYVVRKECGSGGTKQLHRNHLLPVNHLPIHLPPAGKHRVADRKPKQCKVRTEGRMPSTDAEEEDLDAESDSSSGE